MTKIARYSYKGHIRFGILEDGLLHELERTPFTGGAREVG
ncbi:DUF2437 domain-containing protein [Candidatus Solincola tengchongensis]